MNMQQCQHVLCCTNCASSNSSLIFTDVGARCSQCEKLYPKVAGSIRFFDDKFEHSNDSSFQQNEMFNNSLTAKIYNFGRKFVSSEYLPVDQVKELVASIEDGKVAVELGSGNRRLNPRILNVDLFPFPNVDLTMDIHRTAFRDASVDYVILDCVLEHVEKPELVVNEIYRILKPGGQVVCTAPWIFPYHGYPKNFFNISQDGHRLLFEKFASIHMEMHYGPTVALINVTSEYLAVAFSGGHKFLYTLFKGLFLLPIFWLKYLDWFWSKQASALRMASTICVTATK